MSSSSFRLLIFVTLTLIAAGIYFAATQFSSTAEQIDPMADFKASQAQPPAPSGQVPHTELAPVEVMLTGLKQRLEKEPNDVSGWVLLSKSYYHLNRWQEAQLAFEQAKAMGYVGSWQPLPRIDALSQNGASMQNFSSALEFRDYKTGQDGKEPGTETGPAKATGLKLKVALNSTLEKEFSAASPVFIFVRAADNPGPPLAVVRKTVGELPFEFAINDSHAMIAGRTISSAENIIVGARISVSGGPERQPGDYEKLSAPLPSNFNETIELIITDKI